MTQECCGRDRVTMLARFVTGSGLMGMISGVLAWVMVRAQITHERIVVPGGARMMAGRAVTGPVTAYAQAEAIKQIALGATGIAPPQTRSAMRVPYWLTTKMNRGGQYKPLIEM